MAPVVAMRPALSIGMHGDRYIQRWFQRGAQGKLHVDYDVPGETATFPTRNSSPSCAIGCTGRWGLRSR